jgi:soluble lytic murein transglycosylase
MPALSFALFTVLLLSSCVTATPVTGDDFYEGLLKRQEGSAEEAAGLFEKALGSSNRYIREAAAAELLRQHLTGNSELSPKTQKLAGSEATGSWADAYSVISQAETSGTPDAVLTFMLNRSTSGNALTAMEEWLQTSGSAPVFSQAENDAIAGRMAIHSFRYGEALNFFRSVLEDSPSLFFKYPDLISDFGAAFQYTADSRDEGIRLFLELDEAAAIAAKDGNAVWQGHSLQGLVNGENENEIRFRLLFYAGRIARQREMDSIELFQRALPFAMKVSDAQSDAAVWYILRSAIDKSTDLYISFLERYISLWHSDAYFSDVMDRLSRQLIADWKWDDMMRVFQTVRGRHSGITAKYAWIIARAIQEGYIPADTAARTLDLPAKDPVSQLMRLAFDSSTGSLYYRLMSARFLGETFLALPGSIDNSEKTAKTDAVLFLMGFFENGAGDFALPYIRAIENELSPGELSHIAEALAGRGDYINSIALLNRNSNREDFDLSGLTRRDWELWYPRPFDGMIEKYSEQEGLAPYLMLALIRAESAFMPSIVSRAGATGLTQLMVPTAAEIAERIRRQTGVDLRDEDGNIDRSNPEINVQIGTAYLGILTKSHGDPLLALLAYNGGTGRVGRWQRESAASLGLELPVDIFMETVLFPETRNYGRSITAATEVYRMMYFDQ